MIVVLLWHSVLLFGVSLVTYAGCDILRLHLDNVHGEHTNFHGSNFFPSLASRLVMFLVGIASVVVSITTAEFSVLVKIIAAWMIISGFFGFMVGRTICAGQRGHVV